MTTPQRIRRSTTQWREILQQFSDSGLSATAFCKRNEISYGTFVRWRHKLACTEATSMPDKPSADWLPIHLTDSVDEPERTWEIELELPGGVQLRMRSV
jgi:putative transposase